MPVVTNERKSRAGTVRRLFKRWPQPNAGVAVTEMEKAAPLILPVAGDIKLVKVQRGENRVFSPEDIEHIFCLELGRDQFSVQEAIDWVRGAHNVDPYDRDVRIPVIVVLANARDLSVEELDRIHEELLPAGAIFAEWAEGSNSFDEAFRALREQIARNYGPADFSDAPQWGGVSAGVRTA